MRLKITDIKLERYDQTDIGGTLRTNKLFVVFAVFAFCFGSSCCWIDG